MYTKWKCDRTWLFALKFHTCELGILVLCYCTTVVITAKTFGTVSEETERRRAWYGGYPHWRDPIGKRNEVRYKRTMRDNDVDPTDQKWTGVPREVLMAQVAETQARLLALSQPKQLSPESSPAI